MAFWPMMYRMTFPFLSLHIANEVSPSDPSLWQVLLLCKTSSKSLATTLSFLALASPKVCKVLGKSLLVMKWRTKCWDNSSQLLIEFHRRDLYQRNAVFLSVSGNIWQTKASVAPQNETYLMYVSRCFVGSTSPTYTSITISFLNSFGISTNKIST